MPKIEPMHTKPVWFNHETQCELPPPPIGMTIKDDEELDWNGTGYVVKKKTSSYSDGIDIPEPLFLCLVFLPAICVFGLIFYFCFPVLKFLFSFFADIIFDAMIDIPKNISFYKLFAFIIILAPIFFCKKFFGDKF